MSVFSFSKTNEVWGLGRSITMNMIDWWIGRVGPKPYLRMIQASYEHGVNHGDLENVEAADKAELRMLVDLMLEIGFEKALVSDTTHAPEVRRSLVELRRLINADLEGTEFQSFLKT